MYQYSKFRVNWKLCFLLFHYILIKLRLTTSEWEKFPSTFEVCYLDST